MDEAVDGATDGAQLARALDTIAARCLAVAPGEVVVVVADAGTAALGAAMVAAAQRRGGDARLLTVPASEAGGNEPGPEVAAALLAADAFLSPTTTRSLSHTRAVKDALAAGARGATLPGVTTEMIARLMSVDVDAMRARGVAVARLLDAADTAQLTCPHGTDLTLDLSGRRAVVDDGDLTARHAFGNLPAGEAFVSPLAGEGTIAVSSGPPGLLDEPMPVTVRDGRMADVGGPHGRAVLELMSAHGPLGLNLAELGVGTNEAARITGNVLEDEKALGTAHLGFGASAGIGGTVSVPIHRDFVVREPTLDVGGTRVLDRGRWLLGA